MAKKGRREDAGEKEWIMKTMMKLALIAVTAIIVQMGSVDRADALVVGPKGLCGGKPCTPIGNSGGAVNPGGTWWDEIVNVDNSISLELTVQLQSGVSETASFLLSDLFAVNTLGTSTQALQIFNFTGFGPQSLMFAYMNIVNPDGRARPAALTLGHFTPTINLATEFTNYVPPTTTPTAGFDYLYVAGYGVIELISQDTSAPVPEPSTIILLGAGLAGLVAVRKRKQTVV